MKFYSSVALKSVLSFLLGLSFALVFAFPYFNDETYTLLDKFFIAAVPAFALTCVLCFLYPFAQEKWIQTSFSSQLTILTLATLAAGVVGVSMRISSPLLLIAEILSLAAIFSALILPAAPFLQKIIEAKDLFRLSLSWLLAAVVAFFTTGFLRNFYAGLYQIVLLAIFSQFVFGIFSYYAVGRIKRFAQRDTAALGIASFLFVLLIIFQVMIFRMGMQFPKLFNAGFFLLAGKEIVLFGIAGIISLPWLAWMLYHLKEPDLYRFLIQNKFAVFVRENLSGLLLSALFFGLYLLIGSVLNHSQFDVDDIFFDADGFIWRYRLTTDQWRDFYWRSVHPLALLILKPSVNLLSVFLRGDKYFAAIILTAMAGAVCVFLVWMFMKEVLQNTVSALIMAFLMGISASHLIFGSLIETYIFLATATLLFFVMIQKGIRSLSLLIPVGVVTMGVTLTNFAQIVIALFGAKPNLRFVVKYIFIVVVLVVSSTLVSNLAYPNAGPYFFVPSSFLAERQNVRAVSLNRSQALIRAFLFNDIVAPSPLLSHKDIAFTQFRFYRAEDFEISEYSTPLQSVTVWTWFAFLSVAAFFFIKDFKSHKVGLTRSLMACVMFNLLFHLRYGKELFLYSPNWTYAVVLLLGISWKNLLAHKRFQILLIAFLVLLMFNNAALLYTIISISSQYIR